MVCVFIGQLLLGGLLSGGLQDDVDLRTQTGDCVACQHASLAVRLPDQPAESPDRPQSLSSGTGERSTGTDRSWGKKLRRDLSTCRLLVLQPEVGSVILRAAVLPASGIGARGIRLQI